jgi:hypothetical protein
MHGSRGQLYVRAELVQNQYSLAEMISGMCFAVIVESVAPKPAPFKDRRDAAPVNSTAFVWWCARVCHPPRSIFEVTGLVSAGGSYQEPVPFTDPCVWALRATGWRVRRPPHPPDYSERSCCALGAGSALTRGVIQHCALLNIPDLWTIRTVWARHRPKRAH